jgi:DNA-binding NarL/FixJ family response regulator
MTLGRVAADQKLAPERVTVMVVDDHAGMREELREILSGAGFNVVASASDGGEAVRLAVELLPDIMVMDLHMPRMGGIEAIRRITGGSPRTRALVLTVSAERNDVFDAMLAGASGYLLKDSPPEAIVEGVKAATAGESMISPKIASMVLDRVRDAGPPDADGRTLHTNLSKRELEVLRLVATGLSNEEIAARLFISVNTVKKHVANILDKLHLENRIQAAGLAVRMGIR